MPLQKVSLGSLGALAVREFGISSGEIAEREFGISIGALECCRGLWDP